MRLKRWIFTLILWIVCISIWVISAEIRAQRRRIPTDPSLRDFRGLRTNTDKSIIDLKEIMSGGPGKDGIPAILKPNFIKADQASRWLTPKEPVISLVVNGKPKAYPLQILMWHEMVNDRIDGVPVLVTFCPLCYTAIAFDRTVDGQEEVFGVSGLLRHSNLLMYDKRTESLWQQVTGQAVVGDMTGKQLKTLPAQIISYQQFVSAWPQGLILSQRTGYARDYGRNPYVGYDDISQKPYLFNGPSDDRLKPMEKVIAVTIGSTDKAYPYSLTAKERVINDVVADYNLVVFHDNGAVSAMDQPRISMSRETGSTGVFSRMLDKKILSFVHKNGNFYDEQTNSVWDITGQAKEGPLKGKKLEPIAHGDFFAFIWLVSKPKTQIYGQQVDLKSAI
ncbi:MAG: DUF3179 domain-containing protein [Planctomycetota bacterium]|jgi:hypothetical protein